jgi:hypothetical protein
LAATFLASPAVAAPNAARMAGAEDYSVLFGRKYAEAERFLRDNAWIAGALALSDVETRIALATVFPEVLRFSVLVDKIQVRGLKVLYVQSGRRYADFSIGRFQMKPSFAETVERDYNRLVRPEEKKAAGISAFETGETSELRRGRILRLDDDAWQVKYLRIFMMVMARLYAKTAFAGIEDRVRFYAAAYNRGYTAGERPIRAAAAEKRFHVALLFPSATYSYSEIALDFFRRL